jgi:hypothetical protein
LDSADSFGCVAERHVQATWAISGYPITSAGITAWELPDHNGVTSVCFFFSQSLPLDLLKLSVNDKVFNESGSAYVKQFKAARNKLDRSTTFFLIRPGARVILAV